MMNEYKIILEQILEAMLMAAFILLIGIGCVGTIVIISVSVYGSYGIAGIIAIVLTVFAVMSIVIFNKRKLSNIR
jgi:FtsH-binding integral membrane protein